MPGGCTVTPWASSRFVTHDAPAEVTLALSRAVSSGLLVLLRSGGVVLLISCAAGLSLVACPRLLLALVKFCLAPVAEVREGARVRRGSRLRHEVGQEWPKGRGSFRLPWVVSPAAPFPPCLWLLAAPTALRRPDSPGKVHTGGPVECAERGGGRVRLVPVLQGQPGTVFDSTPLIP